MIRREEGSSSKRWTVAELLKWTEEYFQRLRFETPRLDAEVLLAHALANTRLELYTGYHKPVEPEERVRFRGLVERRAHREPVAYITGRREFYSLSFEVTPAVLIPRPETEHLVEAALEEHSKACSNAAPEAGRRYRVIVSNPPYIAKSDFEKLMESISSTAAAWPTPTSRARSPSSSSRREASRAMAR